MIHIKQKNPINIDQVTVTKAIRFSILHYAMLALMITCIILRAQQQQNRTQVAGGVSTELKITPSDISESKDLKGNRESQFQDCAYTVRMQKTVTAWEHLTITVQYNPKKNQRSKNDKNGDECIFDDQNGGSTFRIQLYSIFEMTSNTTSYLGNGTYQADVLLTIPGKYVAMVLVTYIHHQASETRYHVNPSLQQLKNSPFEVIVLKKNFTASSLTTQTSTQPSKYCTRNASGIVNGRWVKCGSVLPKTERCGPWQSSEFDFDKINGFHWLPYTCQYHTFTNDEIKRCFARHGWDSIVFVGDSHMRYRAYHWATRLYGSCPGCVKTHIQMVFENEVPRIEWVFDARGTRLPLSFKNITLPFEKYIHPRVRRSKFSTPFSSGALNSKLFLLNFGHWVLREAYDVEFMEQKLHAYGRAAKYLMAEGKTVVWINTLSLPWRLDKAVKLWHENTSPRRVKHFNAIADRIMKSYGVPIVDAFSVSDGRIGATHDQTHYTKKLPGNEYGGVVENAVSNVIFNKLCGGGKP